MEDKLDNDDNDNRMSMMTTQSEVIEALPNQDNNINKSEYKLDASVIKEPSHQNNNNNNHNNSKIISSFEIIEEHYPKNKNNSNNENNNISQNININIEIENEKEGINIEKDNQNELKQSTLSTNSQAYHNINLDSPAKTNDQISSYKTKKEYLEVEDHGNQKSYLGNVKKYEISLITFSGQNEENQLKEKKKILCYRRYSNFFTFYSTLQRLYPHYIFPKLSEKNFLTKLTNSTPFLERRRIQLKFLINYLYNHPYLSQTKLFIKFIKDAEFDDNYYNEITPCFYYPEITRLSSGNIITKISFNYFYNKIYPTQKIEKSEREVEITKNEEFYKSISEKVNQMFIELNKIIIAMNQDENILNDMTRTFLFLKSKKEFSHLYNEEKSCNVIYQLSIDLYENYKSTMKSLSLDEFVDLFDEYNLMLSGVCEGFDRYNEFIKLCNKVFTVCEECEKNGYKGTNIEKVRKEAEQVVMDKTEFEDKLTEEIIFFSKKYQNMFENLIQGFFTILNTLNQEEMTILKETTGKFD